MFAHPTWTDNHGIKHLTVPKELSDLREGEKLLIQQVSPYIPLQHLQKGTYGCKGHVCSFPQTIHNICTVLPRLPSDISIVNIVKDFRDKDQNHHTLTFQIRKQKVLDALIWLKQYNPVYHNITIVEGNLAWIKDQEALLPSNDIPNNNTLKETPIDLPEERQHYTNIHDDPDPPNSTHTVYGYISTPQRHNNPPSKDSKTTQELEKAYAKMNKSTTVDFPYVSSDPVNEFDETSKLFCKAFPWLFPGGVGDAYDYSEIKESTDDWLKRLLYYHDGRFAADKMWGFYALNFTYRKKNCDSGAYFVNGFYENGPQTLDELKEEILQGNLSWVDRLAYFSLHVKGSPGYWRTKRSEVYSWINHHIEVGNGPPSFFITLSCAEHYWPDIQRLIQNRFDCVGLSTPKSSQHTLVNDYALITQEYFQQRVTIWLKTIGKPLFGIKHHWLRYEFAPGRGQIHAHMLAISDCQDIQNKYYSARDNPNKQAKILAEWVKAKFAMTASTPKTQTPAKNIPPPHPSTIRFTNITNIMEDCCNCQQHLQKHRCNIKCLRSSSNTHTKKNESKTIRKRTCKAGAGMEATPGKGDTPGFQMISQPRIVQDPRGFKRLELERNDPRLTQSSMIMTQSWRANCDIQILLYESDPNAPDPSEIARATDYIVAYACKGVGTLQEEKTSNGFPNSPDQRMFWRHI